MEVIDFGFGFGGTNKMIMSTLFFLHDERENASWRETRYKKGLTESVRGSNHLQIRWHAKR